MSDLFPLDWEVDPLFGGLMSSNEVFWQDMNRKFPDATPMTKAETIMRREEALKMKWPMFVFDVDPITV